MALRFASCLQSTGSGDLMQRFCGGEESSRSNRSAAGGQIQTARQKTNLEVLAARGRWQKPSRRRFPQHSAQVFDFKDGAGEGNRTLVISLEGCCSICCGRCMLTSDLSSISPLGATA